MRPGPVRLWSARLVRAVFAALWLVPGAAGGHPIYVSAQTQTITDQLNDSPIVVLARPTPDAPFRFQPRTWLKGGPRADLPAISHHVDSVTRRRLSLEDADSVLFVHGLDENGWRRLAYGDAQIRRLVSTVLSEASRWTEGRDDPARFRFFAALHDDPDPTVRSLALGEILNSRYRLIRTLKPNLDRAEIERSLSDPMKAPLSFLYVVMLGLIDDAGAADLVRETVAHSRGLRRGVDLTAWATALIEIDGRDGVDVLADMVVGPRPAAQKTAQTVLTALALHGAEGRVALREHIAQVLGDAAARSPTFAALAAATLVQWDDWRAAPAVKAHLAGQAPIGLRERFALTGYLAAAQQAATSSANAP